MKILKYLLLLPITCLAVTLQWDPSPDNAQYYLYAGTNSFYRTNTPLPLTNYVAKVNCGTNLTCSLTNLTPGKIFYFVATAYTNNLESLPSNEVIYVTPNIPAPPGGLRTVYVEYSGEIVSTNWQNVGYFRIKIGN